MSKGRGSKMRTMRRVRRMSQQTLPGIKVDPEPIRAREVIVPLYFEGQSAQVILIDGEPWWIAAEVCRILEIVETHRAIDRLDDDEKGRHTVTTLGGPQEVVVINEAGLYNLVFTSRKPEAKRFKRWITHEVLPSIRKTGSYSISQRGPISKIMRRLGCDEETALARFESRQINKDMAARLKSEGACQNDYKASHNAVYRGQFGDEWDAPSLRVELGQGPDETPLDRMSMMPLAINTLAKAEARKVLETSGVEITPKVRVEQLYKSARQVSESSLRRLGDDFVYDFVDDANRGRIIDVIDSRPALDQQREALQ